MKATGNPGTVRAACDEWECAVSENTWTPPGGDAPQQPTPSPFDPPAPAVGDAPVPPVAPEPAPAPPAFPPPAFPPPAAFPPPSVATGGPANPGTPAWTPPPKPGLIPLRPLTLGTMLGASFQVLRRNPRPMFGFALLLTGAVSLLAVVLSATLTFVSLSRLDTVVDAEDANAIAAGSVATLFLSALIPITLSIAAVAVLQGVVVLEVARGTVGEKLTLRGLFRGARGRIWPLIGWSLLLTAAAVVAVTIAVLLIVLLSVAAGSGGPVVAAVLTTFAILGAVVLAFWLGTRLSLVPAVLVIERLPLRYAVPRAWTLTHGYFWKTLGIQLLVGMILSTVSSIINLPFSFLLLLAGTLINPNADVVTASIIVVVIYAVTVIVSVVFGAISAVVQSATTALIYIDIRMRKEGLDLELAHFVEARQAGDTSVADPYVTRQGMAQA